VIDAGGVPNYFHHDTDVCSSAPPCGQELPSIGWPPIVEFTPQPETPTSEGQIGSSVDDGDKEGDTNERDRRRRRRHHGSESSDRGKIKYGVVSRSGYFSHFVYTYGEAWYWFFTMGWWLYEWDLGVWKPLFGSPIEMKPTISNPDEADDPEHSAVKDSETGITYIDESDIRLPMGVGFGIVHFDPIDTTRVPTGTATQDSSGGRGRDRGDVTYNNGGRGTGGSLIGTMGGRGGGGDTLTHGGKPYGTGSTRPTGIDRVGV